MTERRRDPITGEWRTFAASPEDPEPAGRCRLCPTVDPATPTDVPWPSFDVAVIESRFPSLQPAPPTPEVAGIGVHRVRPATGADEIVVSSDDHGASLASLGAERVRLVVDVWAQRYAELGSRDDIAYVLVFENRAGDSDGLTHPHSQVHGYPDVPPLPARELDAARRHLARRRTCVQCDVVAQERAEGLRVVAENQTFLAFVPFAARLPYEVHVAVHRHAPSLLDLSDLDRDALAEILVEVVARFDSLFGRQVPYVMSVHQAPTDDQAWEPVSHLHIEFSPVHPSADRRHCIAGSELAAGASINDVAPEQAAAALRGAR